MTVPPNAPEAFVLAILWATGSGGHTLLATSPQFSTHAQCVEAQQRIVHIRAPVRGSLICVARAVRP
jgi:hypothetical protein